MAGRRFAASDFNLKQVAAMPKSKSRNKDNISSPRAKKAVERLETIWRRGRELMKLRKQEGSISVVLRSLRKQKTIGDPESGEFIYKAIQFAERYKTKAQLDELFELRLPNGSPLSWSCVIVLLSVEDSTVRLECAKTAATQALSSNKLRELVHSKLGTGNQRPGSGRQWLKQAPVNEAVKRISQEFEVLEAQLGAFKKLDGISGVVVREAQIDGVIGYVKLCQQTFESSARQFE